MNKIQLPKIGRPSKSGLSVKMLGEAEYNRRRQEFRRRTAGIAPRRFTGLSPKILGWTKYRAAFRRRIAMSDIQIT